MKIKHIFLGLFLAFTINCFAQTGQNTTPPVKTAPVKQEYSMPSNKQFGLTAVFSEGQFQNFVIVLRNGAEAIRSSDKLNGAQITGMLKDYQIVSDSLTNRLQHFLNADYQIWAADTAKKVKPVKK